MLLGSHPLTGAAGRRLAADAAAATPSPAADATAGGADAQDAADDVAKGGPFYMVRCRPLATRSRPWPYHQPAGAHE